MIYARWWDEQCNWGDALNPILIEHITGERPINVNSLAAAPDNEPIYVVTGSILSWYDDPNLVVWGTGFMRDASYLKVMPKEIRAVRGPLTRRKIISQGYDCPPVFGDPALLYPRYYLTQVNKRYRLGIIPHFSELNSEKLAGLRDNDETTIVDMGREINAVVDEICSCEFIVSSSLHGIIIGDAYGIPSMWMELENRGVRFKFEDYLLSVGREVQTPLQISTHTKCSDIMNAFKKYEIDIDLDTLYDVCPFSKSGKNCEK